MTRGLISFDLEALRIACGRGAAAALELRAAGLHIESAIRVVGREQPSVSTFHRVVDRVAHQRAALDRRMQAYDAMTAVLSEQRWLRDAFGDALTAADWVARAAGLTDASAQPASDAAMRAAARRLDRSAAWFAARSPEDRARWLASVVLMHRGQWGRAEEVAPLFEAIAMLRTEQLPARCAAANAAVLHALQCGLAECIVPSTVTPIATVAFAAYFRRVRSARTREARALARLHWQRAVRLAWTGAIASRPVPASTLEECFAALHGAALDHAPARRHGWQWLFRTLTRVGSPSLIRPVLEDFVTITQRLLHNAQLLLRRSQPSAKPFVGTGNLVVGIGGLGSSWDAADPVDRPIATDFTQLGYAPDDVHYFSYRADGGSYRAADSYDDLDLAARRLADQLRRLHAEHPDRAVDLIGHSQGGVVETLFLARYYDPADATLPRIEHVLALGAPLQGAPLADAARAVDARPAPRVAARSVAAAADIGLPPAGARSVAQLGTESEVTRDLARLRIPAGVRFQAIAGTDDYVVPASLAALPGTTAWTINPPGVGRTGDHSALAASETAYVAMRRALNHEPEPAPAVLDAARNSIEPVLLARAERTLGFSGFAWAG